MKGDFGAHITIIPVVKNIDTDWQTLIIRYHQVCSTAGTNVFYEHVAVLILLGAVVVQSLGISIKPRTRFIKKGLC